MRNIKIPTNLISELNVPQIVDITDELPKNKVKDWDALNPMRKAEDITDIVWHHTGVFLDKGASAKTHATNHIRLTKNEPTGDGGIPYAVYIKGGQIQQTNNLLSFLYGVQSTNKHTLSVVVEGRYSPLYDEKTGILLHAADVLSEENLRAMIAVELTLRPLFPNYKATNGHNYYKPTACPGFSMTKFKEEINTTRLKLHQGNLWSERVKKAGRLNSQINYMDSLIAKGESDGNAAWALHKKELIYKIMESQKLL